MPERNPLIQCVCPTDAATFFASPRQRLRTERTGLKTAMNRMVPHLLALKLAVVTLLAAQQVGLEEILERMDQQGKNMESMKAGIQQKKWTEILEEFDEGESGTFLFWRAGDELYIRKDIDIPQINHLVIAEGELVFYQPAIKQAQRYQMGSNKDKAEFLLLGFGGDRGALKEAYTVSLLREEQLGSGKAYVLELVPKSENVTAYFSRILLWVDGESWLPVQQRLIEPTGDFLQVEFSDIEVNPRLSRADFKLKIPKDVRIVGQ